MSDSKDSISDSDNSSASQSQSSTSVQLKSSMLRPSLFGSSLKPLDSTKPSIIEDPKVNPFLKEVNSEEPEEKCNEKKQDEQKSIEKEDPLSALKKNGLPKSNLFTTVKKSIAESSGFVFGENVHERVVGEKLQAATKSADGGNTSTDPEKTDSTPSTSSNLLFSNAIQNSNTNNQTTAAQQKENDNKSLTEIAKEYEESRAQKRKYEEVETFTGEENEVNVIDISCKLFAFINRNWEERGRGSLRLNDSKDEKNCSRVVFRTSGNLRLLVNTKVWPGMVAERPSQKSLRLTAMDNNGQIKIFLAMSRPDDIAALHNALRKRIDGQKKAGDVGGGEEEEGAGSENSSIKNNSKKNNDEDEQQKQQQIIIDNEEKEDSNLDEPSPKKPSIDNN